MASFLFFSCFLFSLFYICIFNAPLQNRLDEASIRRKGERGWGAKYYTVEKDLEFEHGNSFIILVIKHISELYKCHLRE